MEKVPARSNGLRAGTLTYSRTGIRVDFYRGTGHSYGLLPARGPQSCVGHFLPPPCNRGMETAPGIIAAAKEGPEGTLSFLQGASAFGAGHEAAPLFLLPVFLPLGGKAFLILNRAFPGTLPADAKVYLARASIGAKG